MALTLHNFYDKDGNLLVKLGELYEANGFVGMASEYIAHIERKKIRVHLEKFMDVEETVVVGHWADLDELKLFEDENPKKKISKKFKLMDFNNN